MIDAAPRTLELTVFRNSKLKETFEIPEEINVLSDGEKVPAGHSIFRILCQEKGDERLTWNAMSLPEIQAAKNLFVDLIKKGFKPFHVGVDGNATSEAMSEFDPHAEEVIFLPQALVTGG